MATETAEIERKFVLDRSRRVPSLLAAPSVRSVDAPSRFTQVAVYFDTPDLRLLGAKVTLRRRTGGTDDGWHLKLPGSGDTRTEMAEPLAPRDEASVPSSLRAKVADIIGASALVPVATLSTRRSVRQIKGLRGKILAQLMDDTVTASLPGQEPHHIWRELEVELVRGTPEVLEEIAEVLVKAGIEPSDSPSKAAQALRPRLGDLPKVKPGSPAGDHIISYLADQVGVLQSRVDDLRVDAPDAVHKSRVATRRIRSLLKSYRPLFDREVTDPIREELKWFAGVLGAPRDAEVQRDGLLKLVAKLDPEVVRGPVVERLETELGNRHAVAHAALVNTLGGRRYLDLMAALVRLVSEPPLTDVAQKKAKNVIPVLVARQEKKVVKLAKAADKELGAEREELLHEVRKEAKAARYACEALPGFGTDASRSASAWEAVTEILGAQQDSVVARTQLLELADVAASHGEETFTYGILHGLEAARSLDAVSDYETALAVARSKKVSGWTRG